MDRSAIDTIRGYCYQFDKSILEILSLNDLDDSIEVEGIEDVDIESGGELRAVQCKYYEKTSYNHSVIAKPIRLMLEHFSKNKKIVGKYHLFGHYKDGQEKLVMPITVDDLKVNFLTYTKDSVLNKEHIKLSLSESDLQDFLKKLVIDIHAVNFDEQQKSVIDMLSKEFSCSKEEAMHYFYNAAFNLVTKLGCNHDSRKISKSDFLKSINNTKSLFNSWLYKYKGRKQYLKKIKSDLFPRNLNTQPYERFFIIDVTNSNSTNDIKECIHVIQNNWSNLSRRSPLPYSPFIYLYGKDRSHFNGIKNDLYNEGLIFSDGYNFKGSHFCVDTVLNASKSKDIKFQYIDSENDLVSTIKSANSRVELYQFYTAQNELTLTGLGDIKNTKVQILEFNDIKDIV